MPFYDLKNDTSNFVISWTGDPRNDFGMFAKGYISAADHLAKTILQAPHFSDYEAYPVVFLYRHALELSLKHIIYRCAGLGALKEIESIRDELHNNHRLDDLMEAAAASLKILFPSDLMLASLIPRCRQTCLELSHIDPNSFSFRYPMDKKGRYATRGHLTLNLSSFALHMSSVLEDLDTVRFGLNGEIDVAEDALSFAIRNGLRSSG